MREAHAHIPWHARALSMLDLSACSSHAECLDLVARSSTPPGQWRLAKGARVESWRERGWPSLAALDRVTGDSPCLIMSFDHHCVMANTRALALSRVLEEQPAGGVIVRDDHANPTGVLLEAAAYHAWNAAPQPAIEQLREIVPQALQDLARHGFTEVHDLFAPAWLGPLLAEVRTGSPMDIRLYAPLEGIEHEQERSRGYQREHLTLAGAKIFADGTLNSRTALMLHPYADPLPGMERGKVITSTRDIQAAIERTRALGLELAVHAIGDGAVRSVLDAAERAARHAGSVSHLRIEHCELIDESDIPRFAQLGVRASVQPCHLLADIEALHRHLPHRLERVLPLRELIDSGLTPGDRLMFGSDTPVVRPHPGDSIQAAVHRRREGAPTSSQVAPAQAITEDEARACFRPHPA